MTDEEKRPDTADSDSAANSDSTADSDSNADSAAPAEAAEQAVDSKADTERGASSEEETGASESTETTPRDISEEETVTANVAELAAAQADRSDAGHGHDGHGHEDHDGHGHGDHDEHLGHTAPMSLLYGVLGALILLTVLTVGVTAIDLGSQGNFIVAMVIATVKAVLVMGYFMHMIWDNKFNVLAFTSSFLFVLLFLAMTVLDRGEYKDTVKQWENDQTAAAVAK